MKPLAVWSPRPDAKPLLTLTHDIKIYGLPVLAIEPIHLLDQHKCLLDSADVLLFISHYAVKHLASQLPVTALQNKILVAIGERTAATMTAYGIAPQIIAPQPFSSEALLNDPVFSQLEYQRLALVCGVGGRTLLQEALQTKGKQVSRIECYQRDKSNASSQLMIEFIERWAIGGITLSSCAVTEALVKKMAEASQSAWQCRIFHLPVFVLSERIGQFARHVGFRHIIVAEYAGEKALNQSIVDWWAKQPKAPSSQSRIIFK